MTSHNQAIQENSNDFLGTVEIAPKVVESIAAEAARQIKGVKAIRFAKGRFHDIFARESGIILRQDDNGQILLETFVEIEHGKSVPEVAQALQQHISEQVYFMADVQLDGVNVHVVNLYMEPVK